MRCPFSFHNLMSSLTSRLLFWRWYMIFNNYFIYHFIYFTRLRLSESCWKMTHWKRNVLNQYKKVEVLLPQHKKIKEGSVGIPECLSSWWPGCSTPVPCSSVHVDTTEAKAIQTHMMPSGVNVSNGVIIVLFHVNMFCPFV